MNKQEFLAQLRKGLSGLPQDDIEERLTFYSEMIEDQTEEGLSEDEAVAQIGSVDEMWFMAVLCYWHDLRNASLEDNV